MVDKAVVSWQQVAKDIEEAEKIAGTRKKIRLPAWIKIVRAIRTTQCPKEFRMVFDIEAHPTYKKLNPQEKVALANSMANMYLDTKDVEYYDQDKYNDAMAYIKQHRTLNEAMVVMYRNLAVYQSQMDDFDEVLQKAREHKDPTKMMTLWRTVTVMNEAFEKEHEPKINKGRGKEKKRETLNLPAYMVKEDPAKKENGNE